MASRKQEAEEVEAKIIKFERLIDEKLRPDLNLVLQKREMVE